MTELCLQFLGQLEREEARLLSWGLVDGYFDATDLENKADQFLDKEEQGWDQFSTARDFLREMEDRGLLFTWFHNGQEKRHRTRMAETIRLLAGLKQLFPRHLEGHRGWLNADSLVSDFRFINRPREYPKRDQPSDEHIDKWVADNSLSPLQKNALLTFLSAQDGEPFTLSGFQVRATTRILTEAKNDASSATMICAGTGSGKTLAFYLPVLTDLATRVEKSSHWVKALAIYPRNELLKDQISETLAQTRRIRDLLKAEGKRPITVGTFFGPTPFGARYVPTNKEWVGASGGYVCPFLTCPESDCSGDLIWKEEDLSAEKERLVCAKCSASIESDEVVLTRRRASQTPPDILFTTTEMMNQRLTDPGSWSLFGVETRKKPIFLLLDEVHTYNGTSGAHIAYLLRRWRQRTRATPHIVGLSATLMEATSFLAQLTGIPSSKVTEVGPESEEMDQSGMEYLVALRGDPVSNASLLSTTIQTAMLIRRALDPSHQPPSQGAYGKKVFLFTDDLDVTTRMFYTLLDAEGQDKFGRMNPTYHPQGSLATLRSRSHDDEDFRFRHAQSWRLPAKLGHDLDDTSHRIPIDRVSSRDSGVHDEAEVIVATSSLEVGFNDPLVGAVIQHKSPRDPASFLQRKGRAGRKLNMRPWTIVVLSDFGQDRLSYQGYDLLFDPELRPRELPLANRQVLKIQASFAFLDWLGKEVAVAEQGKWHIWKAVSRPRNCSCERCKRARALGSDFEKPQERMAHIIEDVLEEGDKYRSLKNWLKHSLNLSDGDALDSLLWDPPRALLTSVLPTLHRRLVTQWQKDGKPTKEIHYHWHPLPEFVPKALFETLNIPEILIITKASPRNSEHNENQMPINSALKEFAPGRITKRFSEKNGYDRHWLPIEVEGGDSQTLSVDSFCQSNEYEELGIFAYYGEEDKAQGIRVLRPHIIRVSHEAPREVVDSSNAFPRWHSQILPPSESEVGIAIDLPEYSRWTGILEEIRLFVHRDFCPTSIRRFTTGSDANLKLRGGESREVSTHFISSSTTSERVALGFSFEADAIRFLIHIPNDWNWDERKTIPALRTSRYRWVVKNDPRLTALANPFELDWLAEVTLSAVVANAVKMERSLAQAWDALAEGTAEITFRKTLTVLFQTVDFESEDAPEAQASQRLDDIIAHLNNSEVMIALKEIIPTLWEDPDYSTWHPWLADRYLATLGAAFRDAIQQMCPEIDVESLIIDINPGPSAPDSLRPSELEIRELWISESERGGGGIIERLLPLLAESPRRFLDLTLGALGPGDFEQADHQLHRFLRALVDPNFRSVTLQNSVTKIRTAAGQMEQLTKAHSELRHQLREEGFLASHAVLAGLNSRILRPGSTTQTDELSWKISRDWRAEEQRLGIEVDPRSLAYSMSFSDELDTALGTNLPLAPGQDRSNWRFNALYSLTWPRGTQARNRSLSIWSPYATMPDTERLLVLDSLEPPSPPTEFGAEDWRPKLESRLIKEGHGRLTYHEDTQKISEFQDALLSLLVTPLDTGSLLVYPHLRGIKRELEEWVAEFEVVVPGQISTPDLTDNQDFTTRREIVKSQQSNREEARDLLESLFAIELLNPGKELWLVSPWITDVPVLDNRAGAYSGIDPAWPKRHLSVAELLNTVLRRNPNTSVFVVTRPPGSNDQQYTSQFCTRLHNLAELDNHSDRLHLDNNRDQLHTKGLAGERFALTGSMNFTNNGLHKLEENIMLDINQSSVSHFSISLHGQYAPTATD